MKLNVKAFGLAGGIVWGVNLVWPDLVDDAYQRYHS